MEPAYLSALAALAGSTIGGLTSLTASWLTQHVQFRTQLRTSNLNRREQLYEHFIDEASAIPAKCLSVNGLLAVWPSVVLYGRSARNHIEQDSSFMRA
jgi:hypothetical protein